MHRFRHVVACWLGLMMLAAACDAAAQATLGKAQLDQLTAPVALYPDALLSQVLMAATYPADVAAAAQWSKANPSLSGDAATRAVAGEPWDPSVQSLAAFPSVLDMMGRQPKWVESVGDAFLAQPDGVMDSVQRLRAQAQKAGSLKTTEQQKVVTQPGSGGTTVIQIEPASPQVVYVPAYNPTVVYGTWPYPAYPPAYYPPPPGSAFATAVVAGIGFGLGVAAVNSIWGGFNWNTHDVNINVNRYNNINVNNRLNASQNNVNWQHNPANRGNVPYNNANVRNRYDQQRQAGLAGRPQGGQPGARIGGAGGTQAAGSREAARDRAAQSFQSRTGESIPGHGGAGERNRPGGERPGAAGGGQQRQLSGAERQRTDQNEARNRARDANRDSALRDAGNGDRLRQQNQRAAQAGQGFGAQQRLGNPGGGARPGAGAIGGGGGGRLGHGRR
ncbi:DUF3300 domain-containing protein [Cupriavidus sp. 30B13]|uniref:DUF3300 domain-containing protein n=1 Tax=Cupriavidus sp. 30B13 TaxID=3384241 RepID=UPI003B8F1875